MYTCHVTNCYHVTLSRVWQYKVLRLARECALPRDLCSQARDYLFYMYFRGKRRDIYRDLDVERTEGARDV